MKLLRTLFIAGALASASLAAVATSAQAIVLDSGTNVLGNASPFGNPDTQTYGQTFLAPISGTLTSFEFTLNGSVGGDFYGGVGLWDTFTHGVSSILYQSANVTSQNGPFTYSFSPNIGLTAGNIYVAFVSVFGTNATTTTSMPVTGGQLDSNLLAFVYHNTSLGSGPGPDATNWEGEFNADAVFKANISAVPVPAALPLLAAGLAGLAGVSRRRKKKAA